MANKNINSHAHEVTIKSEDFEMKDASTYYIAHPISVPDGGGTDNVLYSYSGAHSVSSSTPSMGSAYDVFQNNPNGASQSGNRWGTNWTSHDANSATPGRIVVDFGENVDLVGMEWQGEGNTGYGPISGPNAVRIRFCTNPPTTAVGSTTNVDSVINHNWANLDWGANTSSPNGLAEYLDIRNGGVARTARYVAIDCDTSHDTRNMLVRHILFHHAVPVTANGGITATVNDHVNSFTLRDVNGNTNEGSPTNIDFGVDTLHLGLASVGIEFTGVRVGNTFRVFGTDGSETEVNV